MFIMFLCGLVFHPITYINLGIKSIQFSHSVLVDWIIVFRKEYIA